MRVGEVEMRPFIIPEAGALRRVGLRIANKKTALRHFAIARMILQQAGFDIGGQLQPGIMERLAHHFWLRHLVVVPVKDVALAVDRGIAGRELERVARDRVLLAQADEVHQLILRIRRVGVVHGGAAVAEAPFWPEQGFTGQADEGFGHIQHLFTGKQVIIDIAGLRLPAAIGGVVVVDFIAQIQPAAAQVVIEQAVADIAALGDGKRNMFIQRVGADGVVAHGIEVTHFIALTVALQVAGLFAQAVETLIFAAAQIMGDAVAVSVCQIGAGGAVTGERLPLAGVVAIAPLQPKRLVDGDAQLAGGDGQRVIFFGHLPGREAKTAEVIPRAAFPRHILLRGDTPGAIQRQLALALQQDAE